MDADQEAAAGDRLTGLPPLAGELLMDADARAAAADDFGHIVRHPPLAVLRPGSAADVVAMTRWCRRRRIPLAARGQGHATFGQAQAAGGVVVDTGRLDSVSRAGELGGELVSVGAGATWRAVLRATLPHGLTPAVLTDYLDLSVGGTLSVGGVGGTSHQAGAQVDGVVELEVVTGAGEHVRCSRSLRPELFDAALAGLGQCAVILRATLRLVRAPAVVRRHVLRYPTLAALTSDQRRLARERRFPFLAGQIAAGEGGWECQLEAVTHLDGSPDDAAPLDDLAFSRGAEEIEDLPYLDFLDRLSPSVAEFERSGQWAAPHPWWNMFLPDQAADAVVAATLAELSPADLGASGVILLYPIRTAAFAAPLLRLPDAPLAFLFALLRTAAPDVGARPVQDMLAANRALFERVRAAGGCRYPVGSVPMAPADWRAHYGPVWPRFAAAKERFDPAHILAPGQGVFG